MDEADIKKVDNLAEKIAKQRETVYHEQVRPGFKHIIFNFFNKQSGLSNIVACRICLNELYILQSLNCCQVD